MVGKLQLRKPENWQDFECLCKILWGEIWNCPDTIKRNGRQGQNQHGVDIYCISEDKIHYRGIQCKGKDEYTKSQLTEEEIDREIEKAKTFKPALDTFFFATTAVKDAKIEEYVRQKNAESLQQGGFTIDVFAWEDIVDLIESHRETYNWYVNNCQYKDASDVNVSFMGKEDYVIHPEYFRTKIIYKYKEPIDYYNNPWASLLEPNPALSSLASLQSTIAQYQNPLYPKSEHDYRWCKIPLTLENIGATVIEDYKLSLCVVADDVENIDDRFHYFNSRLMDQAAVAQINNGKDAKRELFQSNEYWNVIEYRPRNKALVQNDHTTFYIDVLPKDSATYVRIEWKLLSRNYSKTGFVVVTVEPKYEDRVETKEVDKIQDVKSPEIIITPKKIME